MINPVAVWGLFFLVAQHGVVVANPIVEVGDGTITTGSQSELDSAAASSKRATDALNRMSQAIQKLNYHGTVVYAYDDVVESMKIIHKNGPDGEVERLVQLGGDPREVIRKNDVVTCYMSDSQSVLVGKRKLSSSLLSKLNTKFTSFGNTYTFQEDGGGRVAGKSARIIIIQPKDDFRYGYKLWLFDGNSLLLKSELIGPQGNVLEQFMFAQLDIVDSIPDAMLKPEISGESFTWHSFDRKNHQQTNIQANLTHPAGHSGRWKVAKLPVGFKITTVTKQQMPNSKTLADHMIISDGLASVSVYIEFFSVQSQPFVGSSRVGAINIYGVVMGDYQVTVVGEVPSTTVKMIADSVYAVTQNLSQGSDG
ncbi:MAG: MucB/RseB C-terminal domain-containing protein [Thiohalomonadales bacterium]